MLPFNDEHCQSFEMNKSFTYMCKLSCNIFMPLTSCDNILALHFTTFEGCSCITVSHMPQLRSVKMDDIYIYNVYTLSLLLATFQIKQRRGRLYFQEGEDDDDINTIVTPTAPAAIHTGPITRARARQLNYQVLSFLANDSNVHENMMLPKLDKFVLLTNEGPSLEKDEHWSKNKNGVTSDGFKSLKPP